MSSFKLYTEILDEFDAVTTRPEKIAVLRKYADARFKDFLLASFHPQIQFDVEIPSYRPAVEPAGLNFSYIDSEMPRLYRFITGHPKRSQNLTKEKQTALLLVILESLHADEAVLFIKMLKKDLGVKWLTPKLVNDAFPDLSIPT